ncbi:hypothetical protein CC1G_15081 [Coprinopsis cinerea okayama7|uniref:Uncharacterized protein n=1 Tax=Coprinopsis cinerea (strain Okayama-7 / 130 / ATCC MYA-4618 / FGSC 9003) TaxID=240176 RepID=D6RPE8_COPC7|nr:hypothetical protein CC1G_15081 [Coprinopsis cinerea okayama7\|eukprot:XP_002910747.1 hypothetical protein CC1G_15081 [Coprinopsis cinerea okayama7\
MESTARPNPDENDFESLLYLAFGDSDEDKASKNTVPSFLDTRQLIIQPRYPAARLPHFINRNSPFAKDESSLSMKQPMLSPRR